MINSCDEYCMAFLEMDSLYHGFAEMVLYVSLAGFVVVQWMVM